MRLRLTHLGHLAATLALISFTAVPTPAQVGMIIQVTTTGDQDNASFDCDVDPMTEGPQCTLRAAIQLANSTPATDSIRFAIPTSDPGYDAGVGTESEAVRAVHAGIVKFDGALKMGEPIVEVTTEGEVGP